MALSSQDLDDIDDRLHDLLMERTAVVEAVTQVKRNDAVPSFRPGRIAAILRRLAARHGGPFPHQALIRIWCELIAGQMCQQTDLTMALLDPGAGPGDRDVARDYFGTVAGIVVLPSAAGVIRAVSRREATVGILPFPTAADTRPWWPFLATSDPATPKVLARLPFDMTGLMADRRHDALVIALGEPESTADDRALLVIETNVASSRAALRSAFADHGMRTAILMAAAPDNGRASILVEVNRFVGAGLEELATIRQRLAASVDRVIRIGCYPTPLGCPPLGGEKV